MKILWDFPMQTDKTISHDRPVIVVKKKDRSCQLVDVSCPGDSRVLDKEQEEMSKYIVLAIEVKASWKLKEVKITPIVIGALGTVSASLSNHLRELDVSVGMDVMQKTVLLGLGRILRSCPLEGVPSFPVFTSAVL